MPKGNIQGFDIEADTMDDFQEKIKEVESKIFAPKEESEELLLGADNQEAR